MPAETQGGELPTVEVASPVFRCNLGRLGTAAGSGGEFIMRRIPDTHGGLDGLPSDWERVDSLEALRDLRPLGQLHDSFIVAAGRDGLWIIDQHVAHERILFEQVLRQRAAGNVEIQQLLMPIVLQLTPGQEFEYARIAEELNAYGFETEPFGQRTIAIKSSPAGVGAGISRRLSLRFWRSRRASFARLRWMRYGGVFARRLLAGRRLRLICD